MGQQNGIKISPELIAELRRFAGTVAQTGASINEIMSVADAMRQTFLDNYSKEALKAIKELTKSSAASLDCLSYMIDKRRKNILIAETYLKLHRQNLSPERVAQIEQDLEGMRFGLHNMETDYCSIAGEPYTDKRNS